MSAFHIENLQKLAIKVSAAVSQKRVHISLCAFKWPFSRWIWVSRYQNISILDFIGVKDDESGGDNWSYKMCKAPVKSSPTTNQHPQKSASLKFMKSQLLRIS